MRKASLVAVVLMLAAGGCATSRSAPQPIRQLPWRTVVLPTVPSGRNMIRAVAACNGHWYVAGAILHPDGSGSPALWTSRDGVNFAPTPIRSFSYYGASNILYSVACGGGDVVAVGASNGGAHGNPRTSTWLSAAGGPLIEVRAAFELYGGPNAIGVSSATAGTPGFLIVGARIDHIGGSGAAVWTSPDGAAFTLHDADPALESDASGATEVHAATPVNDGYVAVGGITPPGSPMAARDPIAWTSSDGATWQRRMLPHSAADDPLMNVAQIGSDVLAVGTDGQRFTAWTAGSDGSGWRVSAYFGTVAVTTDVPLVPSLVQTSAGTAYAVVSTSAAYQLWSGGTGATWQRFALPEAIPAAPVRTGPRVVAAAANGTELMVGADDGTAAHLWFASVP